MTTTTTDDTTARTRRAGSPLPAIAGVGALATSAAAIVVFGDAMAGSDTPGDAATALGSSSADVAGMLFGAYALLAIVVVGGLAARLGRGADTPATRLLPVLGAAHLLLMTALFGAPAAAVIVGTRVFDSGVSAVGAEAALVLMNVVHPMAVWVGAGFLTAVAVAARAAGAPRALVLVSAVFAVGFLLPPIGWAVTYLMGVWFAGVGIWLWLRG